MMSIPMKKWLAAGASIGLLATGATAIATAQSPSPTAPPKSHETVITGSTADQAKAAILAAYPGATIQRMSDETDGKSTDAYEAHITKADGTRIEVFLDSSFKATGSQADKGPGHRGGRHGRPGGSGETPLTGATLASVKAAVLAKQPGATLDHASTENDGKSTDAYEAHVTKADGMHVEVLLNSAFDVTAVNAAPAGGPPRHGGPRDNDSSSSAG
jgi:uncharacterized membrane protein YkoI